MLSPELPQKTPMVGAVTDGAAKIKLQLIVKSNRTLFTDLVWRIADPQISNSSVGKDTLLNTTVIRGHHTD